MRWLVWLFNSHGQHASKPLRMRREQASHSLLRQLAKWSMAEDCTTGSSWWLFGDLEGLETCTDHYLSLSIYSLVYRQWPLLALLTCYSASVLRSADCLSERVRTQLHHTQLPTAACWKMPHRSAQRSSVKASILSSCTSCLVRRCQQDRSGRRVAKDRSNDSGAAFKGGFVS